MDEDSTELRATLVWTDPPGNPEAEQSLPKLKNDLDLLVVSPSAIQYSGNYGLDSSLWSVAEGRPDELNNVENVFIQNPAPGEWTVVVMVEKLVEDGHRETGGNILDTDFALVVTTLPAE